MNSERLKITAQVFNGENTPNIREIANKKGIVLPSSHLAVFKSVYAPIEEANDNGIRLSREAVEIGLPGIVGSQVNLEHFGKGFMVGVILDAWLNSKDEIEIAFTFAKNIYPDEYLRALGRMQEGQLSVSFELLSARETQEHLSDGTIRLNDVDFQGVGLLIDETPAYKQAITYEVANIKERALSYSDNEFVYAKQIVEACDDVLSQESTDDMKYVLITTNDDGHFHLAEIDFEGNGQTFDTVGEDEDHIHMIKSFQIQLEDDHTHMILAEMLAKLQKHLSKTKGKGSDEQTNVKLGGIVDMSEEKQKDAELREDLVEAESTEESTEETVEEVKAEETEETKEDKPEETKEEAPEATEEAEKEAEEKPAEEEATEEEPEAEAEESEEKATEEVNELEEAQKRIAELENEVSELKATIENGYTDAEKIGKLKVELKDNPYVAEFKDEDFLSEEKLEKARLLKENDDLKKANEELSKKDKLNASEDDKLETGHQEDTEEKTASTILRKRYNTNK